MFRAMRALKSVGRPEGLVEGVGVEALRAAEHGGHGLDGGADDVVVGVLLGERHARGLTVGAQHRGLGVVRLELVHELGPQQAGGTELRHLHEEVHADAEEEAEPAGELVDVEALGQCGLHVFDPVGQGECQFEVGGRPGLLHVVARDRDRVELGASSGR